MKSESAWHRADAIAAFRNPQHAEYGWRSNRPTSSSSSSSWAKGGPICGTLSCHTGHGITRAPDDNPLSVHTDDATLDSHGFDHSEALYARSSRDSHAIFACRYTSLLERRRRRTRVKERWIYDEFSWLNRMASLGWTRYRGTSEILDDGADVGGGRRDLELDGNTVSRDLVTFVLPCLEIVGTIVE